MSSHVNSYQDDPIQNRSLSHSCWDGYHYKETADGPTGCGGWKKRCQKCTENRCRGGCPCDCHKPCECLCHQKEPRQRIIREPKSDKELAEVYGSTEIAGRKCDFVSRRNKPCNAIAAKDSTRCLLHGFIAESRD